MAKTILAIGVPDEEKDKGLMIPIPDGFTPPDGTEDGDTFQVMADVKMMDGKLLIEKLDGKDVSDDESDDAEEEMPAKKPTIVGGFKDLMKSKGY